MREAGVGLDGGGWSEAGAAQRGRDVDARGPHPHHPLRVGAGGA